MDAKREREQGSERKTAMKRERKEECRRERQRERQDRIENIIELHLKMRRNGLQPDQHRVSMETGETTVASSVINRVAIYSEEGNAKKEKWQIATDSINF